MSSRGRPTNVGLQRIDAAFDALIPLGFSKKLIKKTIENLLKVYGGLAGWIFIEEASYKVVIDTILEQQEDGEIEDMETDEADNSLALSAPEHDSDSVGETNLLPAITSNNQDPDDLPRIQHQKNESEDKQPPANDVISHGNEPCRNTRLMQRPSSVNKASASAVTIGSSSNKQPCGGEPARKRPPCYGCFSETESDSDDEP